MNWFESLSAFVPGLKSSNAQRNTRPYAVVKRVFGFALFVSGRLVGTASTLILLLMLMIFGPAWANSASVSDESAWAIIGQRLFADQRLSQLGQISCASCHSVESLFVDTRGVSLGSKGLLITRNAPSLLGLRDGQPLFWDGRRQSLEEAVLDPLFSPNEHALLGEKELQDRIFNVPEYQQAFSKLLDAQVKVTAKHVAKALAAYIKNLRTVNSPFDQWRENPEAYPMDDSARLGYELFTGRAGCSDCHRLEGSPVRFTDDQFHAHEIGASRLSSNLKNLLVRIQQMDANTLVAAIQRDEQVSALGRFLVTGKAADIGAFRTPSLRNVALTGPYMHDGSIESLDRAVLHELYYSARDKGAGFSQEERDALVVFLQQLSQPVPAKSSGSY